MESLLLSSGSWCTGFCCALQESVSQSCVSSGSSVVGLMVTFSKRTYAIPTTQSPCPCDRLLPTHTSTGDTQTEFCVSLCGDPGSWCTQGSFEPSEHLWREWGLILIVNLPLLPSYWGCSFALGRGVSPHSCSSASRLTGVSLTLDVGYLLTASPVKQSYNKCQLPI